MSERNDLITPPRSDGTNKNLQQIALTTSSQAVAIDERLRGRCVRFKASVACSFYLAPSNSGPPTVDYALATSVGPTEATLGYQLTAGIPEDFNLSDKDLYVIVDGSAAGVLQLLGSSSRRTGKEGP